MPVEKEALQFYYTNKFPAASLCEWLCAFDTERIPLRTREFSFATDTSVIRYLSYENADQLLAELKAKVPQKIDLGAKFSVSPKEQHSVAIGKFYPKEKEIVFDLDLTDYSDVRLCACKDAQVCKECWQLARCAALVVDHLLEKVFAVKRKLWVFSGRRGVHCWVCDQDFRMMPNEARGAIVDFLSVYKGGNEKQRKIALNLATPHPSFAMTSKTFEMCETVFKDLFIDQWELFSNPDNHGRVLAFFQGEQNAKKLEEVKKMLEKFEAKPDTESNWEEFKKKVGSYSTLEIVYTHVYPRLDVNVSKHLNHLLKSPFCVHPSTGLVSVPFDIKDKKYYPLEDAPKLEDIANVENEPKLAKAIKMFQSFVDTLKSEQKQQVHKEQKERRAAKEDLTF